MAYQLNDNNSSDPTSISEVDISGRQLNTFLERYFKNNLIDLFAETFVTLEDLHPEMRLPTYALKSIAQNIFQLKTDMPLADLEIKLNAHYRSKAQSYENGELLKIFQLLYSNQPAEATLHESEFIYWEVKIKVALQEIERLPSKVIANLQQLIPNLTPVQSEKIFRSLEREGSSINVGIVYFGDINFQIADKSQFQTQYIRLGGKMHRLRIFVFFVSRLALMETFATKNKIAEVDKISEFNLQYYERRRGNRIAKQKRMANIHLEPALPAPQKSVNWLPYGVTAISIIAIAISYYLWTHNKKV